MSNFDKAASLMNLIKTAAEHGTAFQNIAALAQFELQEIEKNSAKDLVERKKHVEERDRRMEAARRQEMQDRQNVDAADKGRDAQSDSADAPQSPEMKNLIHQETTPRSHSGVPNVEDRPMPPVDPTRQPGGQSADNDPNRAGFVRAQPGNPQGNMGPGRGEDPRPRTDENAPRPIMPGEPVRPTPQPISSADRNAERLSPEPLTPDAPPPVDRKI